jgi:hypothetical protein
MSNTLYDNARELFATGKINWTGSDSFKVYLIDSGNYTVNTSTHLYLSDVSTSSRIAGPVALSSMTATAGACDAADITFSSVTGTSIEAILIYKDTGTESTSPLIAYIDTATGLPITPNGGDIIVTWDSGTNKIFRL